MQPSSHQCRINLCFFCITQCRWIIWNGRILLWITNKQSIILHQKHILYPVVVHNLGKRYSIIIRNLRKRVILCHFINGKVITLFCLARDSILRRRPIDVIKHIEFRLCKRIYRLPVPKFIFIFRRLLRKCTVKTAAVRIFIGIACQRNALIIFFLII